MSVLDLLNPFRKLKNQTEVDGKLVVTAMPTVSPKYVGMIEALQIAEVKMQQCITNRRFTKRDLEDYIDATHAFDTEYLKIGYQYESENAKTYTVSLQEIVDTAALRLAVETASKTRATINKLLENPSVCKLEVFRLPRAYKMRDLHKPSRTLKYVRQI